MSRVGSVGSVSDWIDSDSTLKKLPEDVRKRLADALIQCAYDDVNDLMDFKEEHFAKVLDGLAENRAKKFRKAIAALKHDAGSGATSPGSGAESGSEASASHGTAWPHTTRDGSVFESCVGKGSFPKDSSCAGVSSNICNSNKGIIVHYIHVK